MERHGESLSARDEGQEADLLRPHAVGPTRWRPGKGRTVDSVVRDRSVRAGLRGRRARWGSTGHVRASRLSFDVVMDTCHTLVKTRRLCTIKSGVNDGP